MWIYIYIYNLYIFISFILCHVRAHCVQPLFAVPFARQSLSCPMTEKTIHRRPPAPQPPPREGVRLLQGRRWGEGRMRMWRIRVAVVLAPYTYYTDLYAVRTYYVRSAKGTRLCASLAKHCPCSVDWAKRARPAPRAHAARRAECGALACTRVARAL